jgi:Protein of unknown function (DUF1553)/Protein of unknown function (DUF1549)/Planctomycete cytochrome C
MYRFLILLLLAMPIRAGDPDYAKEIAPIFRAKCVACHGAVRQKAGLRLDAGQLTLKGGKDGPVVVPGKPEESSLLAVIVPEKGEQHPHMPPEGEGEAIPAKDVALIRAWVLAGAKAPTEPVPDGPKSHWAYQIPKKSAAPRPGNPIDAFLEADRAKKKLATNPEADKSTLLRRIYLDLVGVPPTADQLAAFLKDDSPTAFEKVVDKLLASPMYGERWGRHWMDVWRYSDPFGNGEEFRYSQRHIWRWRDWIVESLNADKGYDRMIVEMLAGDEIAPGDPNTLRATGYLARNWYKFNRTAWIQDTVDYTAAGFLGTTLRCARCHDHKYDPISQADYYKVRAVFEPHDVRTDPVPGQPDLNKDGVARAFDKAAIEPTYLFIRGDERTPDKSRTIPPGVPFGGELAVAAVTFTPKDFAKSLPGAVAEARRIAKANADAAQVELKRANDAVALAAKRRDDLAAGLQPKDAELKPFLRDSFAKKNDDLWKVQSGQWAWENGKLVCKSPSTFATVSAKTNHPAALMGRIRYKTTGGGVKSVGFSYDVAGNNFQAVYINAGPQPAIRPFIRKNGADNYTTEIVPVPAKVNDEITLDFAVRGKLLNIWVNGQLKQVYTLPMERRPGTFTVWAHDATVEFSEIALIELPDSVPLATMPGDVRPSPLEGQLRLTKDDAEKLLKEAEKVQATAKSRFDLTQAAIATVEARYQADLARFADPLDEAKAKALAAAAAKAEGKPTYTPLVKVDPTGSSGRRLALANWIASRSNPLTARVAVNHIWMRHFGSPLVPTVANFGLAGKKPTHPELLDWLAVELTESNWSMKRIHKLIVTSRAYRLSSTNADGPSKSIDPDNKLYWRANPRRMDAEVVRDSLLAIVGQLDPTLGGPILDEKLGLTSKRRSLYFRFNAEYKMSFLDQFDAASPTECYERRESVIPQQALALHNSSLALNVSRELAKQLAKEKEFVSAAFRSVLCREPTAEERNRCEQFLKEQAALFAKPGTPFPAGEAVVAAAVEPVARAREDLIHVLLNHNDFVTVR